MSARFRWDGSVLRVESMPKGEWCWLPHGPSSAAPFNTATWAIGLYGPRVFHLYVYCTDRACLESSTACRAQFRFTGGLNSTESQLIQLDFHLDQLELDGQNGAKIAIPAPSDGRFSLNSLVKLEVSRIGPGLPRRLSPPSPHIETITTSAYISGLVLSPLPFDVRFTFPRSGQDLWASSAILKDASPYLQDLFHSGFHESQSMTCSYAGPKAGARSEDRPDWSDSDDDDSVSPPMRTEHPLYSITIKDHSFATYHAIWVWMLTKRIKFAPLSSLYPAEASAESSQPPPKRRKTIAAPTDGAASTPAPVSPKSVYRLAHLLELDNLRDHALNAFKQGLSVANVAHQLYSSTNDLYDEIRTASASFAVEHWDEVEKTAGMREMRAKVEARELDHGGVISLALADAWAIKARKA